MALRTATVKATLDGKPLKLAQARKGSPVGGALHEAQPELESAVTALFSTLNHNLRSTLMPHEQAVLSALPSDARQIAREAFDHTLAGPSLEHVTYDASKGAAFRPMHDAPVQLHARSESVVHLLDAAAEFASYHPDYQNRLDTATGLLRNIDRRLENASNESVRLLGNAASLEEQALIAKARWEDARGTRKEKAHSERHKALQSQLKDAQADAQRAVDYAESLITQLGDERETYQARKEQLDSILQFAGVMGAADLTHRLRTASDKMEKAGIARTEFSYSAPTLSVSYETRFNFKPLAVGAASIIGVAGFIGFQMYDGARKEEQMAQIREEVERDDAIQGLYAIEDYLQDWLEWSISINDQYVLVFNKNATALIEGPDVPYIAANNAVTIENGEAYITDPSGVRMMRMGIEDCLYANQKGNVAIGIQEESGSEKRIVVVGPCLLEWTGNVNDESMNDMPDELKEDMRRVEQGEKPRYELVSTGEVFRAPVVAAFGAPIKQGDLDAPLDTVKSPFYLLDTRTGVKEQIAPSSPLK